MDNNAEPVRFKLFNCAFGVHSSLLIGSDAIYDMMDGVCCLSYRILFLQRSFGQVPCWLRREG